MTTITTPITVDAILTLGSPDKQYKVLRISQATGKYAGWIKVDLVSLSSDMKIARYIESEQSTTLLSKHDVEAEIQRRKEQRAKESTNPDGSARAPRKTASETEAAAPAEAAEVDGLVERARSVTALIPEELSGLRDLLVEMAERIAATKRRPIVGGVRRAAGSQRGSGQRQVSDDKVAWATAKMQAGGNGSQIAEVLGVSKSYVTGYMKRRFDAIPKDFTPAAEIVAELDEALRKVQLKG